MLLNELIILLNELVILLNTPFLSILACHKNVSYIDVNISIESHFDGNYGHMIASKRMADFHESPMRFT